MKKALRNIKRKKAREKGAILIVALLVGIAMLIMTTPFLFRHSNQFRDTEKSNHELSAFNLAEAGVEKAIWEQNLDWLLPEGVGIEWVNVGGTETAIITDFTAADGTVVGNINLILTTPAGTAPVMRYLEGTGNVPFIASRTVDRTVRLGLEQYFDSIWDFGFFVDEFFEARNNFLLDSYNSNDPEGYVGPGVGKMGHLGTNNTVDGTVDIVLGGPSSDIYGTVAAGDGTPNDPETLSDVISVPQGKDDQILHGDPQRTVMNGEFILPSVDPPKLPPHPRDMFTPPEESMTYIENWYEYYPGQPPSLSFPLDTNPATSPIYDEYLQGDISIGRDESITLYENNPDTGFTDSGVYSSFESYRGDVTIEGNVVIYITGDAEGPGNFFLDKHSSLNISEGSSLTLILGETSFEVEVGATINDYSDIPTPADLMILGTDEFIGDLMWANNTDTYAAIYVPRGNVILDGGQANVDFFGALISNSITVKANINFHYDEALGDLDFITGGLEKWKIVSWQQPYNATVVEE